MKHKSRNPANTPGKATAKKTGTPDTTVKQVVNSPYVGRPLDGSQYIDVIEEQEYADQRPTAEEQRPRFSYLHDKKTTDRDE